MSDAVPPSENELQWDDVQNELEQSRSDKQSITVTAASFEEIQKNETPKPSLDLDFILDIPLSLTVELGRNRMLISELLQLGQGSVVELTKLAGEPMDVYVNQRLLARGEVVVVNEKFGVRLTDIISPAERINKLR
jgi:flagellar motor switch protein FliN/FliY